MAAFGIPQAHEDDAERAVRAALGILDSVRELGLEARIGIESGEVVVDDAESSTFATGEAVNLAARLQQAAPVNSILIGPGAQRLTLGRFEVEDEGPVEIKGRGEPIWAWRVICVKGGPARLATRRAPLVGRDAELELLENTYERSVRDRRAHLFTIYGDPGVGKSRLAAEFVGGLESATVLYGRALALRGGRHLFSAGRHGQDGRRHRGRRSARRRAREAARLLSGRGGRGSPRARLRRPRGRPVPSATSRRSPGPPVSGRRSSPSPSRSSSSSRTSTGPKTRSSS